MPLIEENFFELTYLLTLWSRVLLEKLTGSEASQEIPLIFGTRTFLTVPTSARHLSLSWANSIQSPQLPSTSWRSILILPSHLRLGLPNGLFPSRFPTRTLCTPLWTHYNKNIRIRGVIIIIIIIITSSSSSSSSSKSINFNVLLTQCFSHLRKCSPFSLVSIGRSF